MMFIYLFDFNSFLLSHRFFYEMWIKMLKSLAIVLKSQLGDKSHKWKPPFRKLEDKRYGQNWNCDPAEEGEREREEREPTTLPIIVVVEFLGLVEHI